MITPEVMAKHLNCDVELNKYSDGTITLECNTCCVILFSLVLDADDNVIQDEIEQDDEILKATFPPEYFGPPIKIPQIQEIPDDMSDL